MTAERGQSETELWGENALEAEIAEVVERERRDENRGGRSACGFWGRGYGR